MSTPSRLGQSRACASYRFERRQASVGVQVLHNTMFIESVTDSLRSWRLGGINVLALFD